MNALFGGVASCRGRECIGQQRGFFLKLWSLGKLVDRRPWEADAVLIVLNSRCERPPHDEKLTCSAIVRIQVHTFLFLVKTRQTIATQEACSLSGGTDEK